MYFRSIHRSSEEFAELQEILGDEAMAELRATPERYLWAQARADGSHLHVHVYD